MLPKLTLDEVNEVLMNERKRRGLTELPPEFFPRALDLEIELKEKCRGEISDSKMMAAREQLHKYLTALRIIHELRALKVMELAKVAFVGGTVDQKFMTSLEQGLLADLSAALSMSRKITMGRPPAMLAPPPPPTVQERVVVAAPAIPATSPVESAPPARPPTPPPVAVVQSPAPEAQKVSEAEPDAGDTAMVIALKDSPTTLSCPDGRCLKFKAKDLFTVPVKMAEVMVKRGMARYLRA